MANLQIDGIKESLRSLLGGIDIVETHIPIEELRRPKIKPTKAVRKAAGFYTEGDEVVLYFMNGEHYVVLRLQRRLNGFTPKEKKLFRPFSKIMAPLVAVEKYGFGRSVEAVLSLHSFEHLLVAASMRGGAATLSTIALPILTLSLMQQLAGTKYEGHACMSGFVFVTKITRFLQSEYSHTSHNVQSEFKNIYEIEPLPEPVELRFDHFSSPASYRYVDGRNSFYVISRDSRVHAIARLKSPKRYGLLERAGRDHISSLLSNEFVPWVTYIGQNADVNVAVSNHTHFRHVRSHWRYIEEEKLISLLVNHHISRELASILNRLACAISDMRVGTLILVPDNVESVPNVAGSIDTSSIGRQLRATFVGKNIVDLSEQGLAVGVLASDGLTTIGPDGSIIGTGDIIDLARLPESSISGGGRTQAALAASRYGISIKVSEDGPISVFTDGAQVLRIER